MHTQGTYKSPYEAYILVHSRHLLKALIMHLQFSYNAPTILLYGTYEAYILVHSTHLLTHIIVHIEGLQSFADPAESIGIAIVQAIFGGVIATVAKGTGCPVATPRFRASTPRVHQGCLRKNTRRTTTGCRRRRIAPPPPEFCRTRSFQSLHYHICQVIRVC